MHHTRQKNRPDDCGRRMRFITALPGRAVRMPLVLYVCAGLLLTCGAMANAQPGQMYAQDNYDDYAQMRGPIHEAFAEPISYDPVPGPLAPVAPPEPISEVPPDYRPTGGNVDWIPGYWAWDDDINDYLWVSGIWRDIPPGREWISGYWMRSDGGFRWIPGFWSGVNLNQTLYLPEPPASIENGPNYATAPSPDYIWVSGSWIWTNQRYAWQPGHWVPGRQDWIWVPAHYVWTPRGYVFVNGYWDYDVDRRGILFAPARFQRDVYRRPNFRYSPRIVVDLRSLTDHLFLRPNHYHYYFGDYFDQRYVNRGYRPWFTARASQKVYDPIYAHRRWVNRNDREWDNHLRRDFDYRRNNVSARPARTWSEQRNYSRNRDRNSQGGLKAFIGKTLTQIVNRKHDRHDFNRIDDEQRRDLSRRRDDVDRIRSARQNVEGRTDGKPDRRYRTRTVPAHGPDYKSPIKSKPTGELDTGHQPPAKPDQPKVDDSVKPRRRIVTKQQPRDKKSDDDKKHDDHKRENDRKRDKKH